MESKWWRDANRGILRVYANRDCPHKFGYRQFDEVIVENLCELWFEQVPHLLGMLNSAMKYPSIIRIRINKTEKLKFDPTDWHLEGWVAGKGFENVRREGEWLIGEKL